jgi:dTDP-glucose 4,6-dehydratase
MRAVVLGGAGFIGSHLVDRLLGGGHEVVAVDSYLTGRRENLAHLEGTPRFRLVEHDVCRPIPVVGPAAVVFNLASPASPLDYERLPLQTLEVGSAGTRNALDLARAAGAVLVQASTSEVYGDPLEHPQRETYFGNVNPIGPRACYDESKRFAEALVTSYARVHGTPVRIGRIFNTYGPRMRVDDGRVVPAFVTQAIRGQDFTVFGDGTQTRSFCYVDDLVEGLLALWQRGDGLPVNLGNPHEFRLLELAEMVRRAAGGGGKVRSVRPLPENDPRQRCPDISRARSLLGWEPRISLDRGLRATTEWFRGELARR